MTEPAPGTVWQHKKGGLYEVLFVATHSETLERLVVYEGFHNPGIWVRPYEMFVDGRFTYSPEQTDYLRKQQD